MEVQDYSYLRQQQRWRDPEAGLIIDGADNLYGTTSSGGTHGYGTVFELLPGAGGSWSEKLLHSFNAGGTDGYNPAANLTMDGSGNLYGLRSRAAPHPP
jgi:uncharacterized repeat protein (TIGR03803 family)